MSGDDYRPREHDHLVEPMFGGLGVGDDACRARPVEPASSFRRFWLRLRNALLRLVRSSRPGSGP